MYRRIAVAVVCAVGLVAASRLASAQTVDEILTRNLAAMGGLEKVKAVQSVKQTATIDLQGLPGTLTVYAKRPDMTRQELSIAIQGQSATVINAFDGKAAWSVNPLMGSPTPVAVTGPQADEIRRQADFDGPLVDWKAKGSTVELVGTEPLGDSTAYHLKLTNAQGQATQVYIDTKTALETKIVHSAGPMGDIEQTLSDYRDVNGLKYPFMILTSGQSVHVQITVQKVELNVPLDDAMFKMPAK